MFMDSVVDNSGASVEVVDDPIEILYNEGAGAGEVLVVTRHLIGGVFGEK